ncbi:MAG: hypothetical protein MZU84_00805 [Sphingobacterium sp.]|nr:hypothetical protein [Sphingobacterium sp.]
MVAPVRLPARAPVLPPPLPPRPEPRAPARAERRRLPAPRGRHSVARPAVSPRLDARAEALRRLAHLRRGSGPRGSKLAREERVLVESRSAGELVLRVQEPSGRSRPR